MADRVTPGQPGTDIDCILRIAQIISPSVSCLFMMVTFPIYITYSSFRILMASMIIQCLRSLDAIVTQIFCFHNNINLLQPRRLFHTVFFDLVCFILSLAASTSSAAVVAFFTLDQHKPQLYPTLQFQVSVAMGFISAFFMVIPALINLSVLMRMFPVDGIAAAREVVVEMAGMQHHLD